MAVEEGWQSELGGMTWMNTDVGISEGEGGGAYSEKQYYYITTRQHNKTACNLAEPPPSLSHSLTSKGEGLSRNGYCCYGDTMAMATSGQASQPN